MRRLPITHRFRFTCTRLLPACALAALLVGPPGVAPSANAADVTYPGSSLGKGPLWNIGNSLFPAGSLSDNVVTINSGNVGGDVYGNDVDAAIIRSFCRAARSAATSWAEPTMVP